MGLEQIFFSGLIQNRRLTEIGGPEFMNALRKCGWQEGTGTHFFQQLRKDGASRGICTPNDLVRAIASGKSEPTRDGKMLHRMCNGSAYIVYNAKDRTLITFSQGNPPAGTSARVTLVQLPQLCGMGYYSYSPSGRQFGTSATINTLQEVAQTFRFNMPNLPIGIGDISFERGGPMNPHQSHQHGTNADIRPLRTDGAPFPVTITDPTYSQETTRLLVESFLAHRNVKGILFCDRNIRGVQFYAGHHNHLHVKMKE